MIKHSVAKAARRHGNVGDKRLLRWWLRQISAEIWRRAAKADFWSLIAFEAGLFTWMGLMFFVFFTDPHLEANSAVFWFLM